MSAIVVIKESDTVVLGTDSRYVTPDKRGIVSDAVEKIQEIAVEAFLATSGYALVCDFQNAKAREVGESTQDIRTLSGILAEASKPILEEAAAALAQNVHLHPTIANVLAGKTVLHGAVLVGRSCGDLGYILMESRCAGGRIETQSQEYFGAQRKISITSATDSDHLACLRNDWRLFSDPPISVVSAALDALKKASSLIGGPTQIVRLDINGSRWISRLPAAIRQATCPKSIGTITAAISMTSPTLVITGSGFRLNVDSSNAMLLTATSGVLSGTTIALNPSIMSVVVNSPQSGITFNSALGPGTLVLNETWTSTPSDNTQANYAAGGFTLYDGSSNTPEVTIDHTGTVFLANLPSSNPGSGTKQLWYDPSDSNRVKFAP
jgi:hypothetical protein